MADNVNSFWTRRRGIERSMAEAINELKNCEMRDIKMNDVNCSPLGTPCDYPNTACNEADDSNACSGDSLLPLPCDEFKDVDNDDCNSVISSEPEDCNVHADLECSQDLLAS